ncbi:MarR family winged helix-turn-helix transcriptional regulator [Maritalea mediterranea]|uniref:MarR family transcriptional regulator n=1 Tax=Maritalea mediterranea TaxID=2909667 RepID=A0ABS9E7P7_9HYPH|nr:MarR family transcriptional regulator [Maritalea mediterranea]MCF4098818.1 MarR family transcriptional regulator [Maritalea mediterranea]
MDRAALAAKQWQKERPELDPVPMETLGRIAELSLRAQRDHIEPLFARYGLQPGEFDVLATLRRAGAPFALSPTALYEATMVSSGGMTNRIDKLEKAGLIERRPNPNDRRSNLVALTAAGRAKIDEMVPEHVANEASLLAALSADEITQLNHLTRKLLVHLDQLEQNEGSQ